MWHELKETLKLKSVEYTVYEEFITIYILEKKCKNFKFQLLKSTSNILDTNINSPSFQFHSPPLCNNYPSTT